MGGDPRAPPTCVRGSPELRGRGFRASRWRDLPLGDRLHPPACFSVWSPPRLPPRVQLFSGAGWGLGWGWGDWGWRWEEGWCFFLLRGALTQRRSSGPGHRLGAALASLPLREPS